MYEAYFTRRLLEALSLADQAADADERSVHLRASRYYRELLESTDSRQAPRHAVSICALLHHVAHTPRAVTVSDLSSCGFRVELDRRVRLGTVVALQMDGLAPLDAYVIWQRGDQVGCKFLTELHPALLDAAIALSPQVETAEAPNSLNLG